MRLVVILSIIALMCQRNEIAAQGLIKEHCGTYLGSIANNAVQVNLDMYYCSMPNDYGDCAMYYRGSYQYLKVGQDIELNSGNLEGKNTFQINEYVNGKCTGYFILNKFQCQDETITGVWVSTDGRRKYNIRLTKN